MNKLFSKLLRKLKAMSLVEVMVGLIVLSAISAAFSPVLINKVKNNVNINVLGETSNNCAFWISGDCLTCDKTKKVCIDCKKNAADCPHGEAQYVDTKTCSCKSCTSHCDTCGPTGKCIRCEAGYNLVNGVCTGCPAGYYCPVKVGEDAVGNDKIICPEGTYCKGDVPRVLRVLNARAKVIPIIQNVFPENIQMKKVKLHANVVTGYINVLMQVRSNRSIAETAW